MASDTRTGPVTHTLATAPLGFITAVYTDRFTAPWSEVTSQLLRRMAPGHCVRFRHPVPINPGHMQLLQKHAGNYDAAPGNFIVLNMIVSMFLNATRINNLVKFFRDCQTLANVKDKMSRYGTYEQFMADLRQKNDFDDFALEIVSTRALTNRSRPNEMAVERELCARALYAFPVADARGVVQRDARRIPCRCPCPCRCPFPSPW
jgi:hypothetical protein